jgi:hypothetical protein
MVYGSACNQPAGFLIMLFTGLSAFPILPLGEAAPPARA